MKNQYFGDINDYRKYGLLRALIEATGLRLGVCWLLTPEDGRTDGEFRRYLREPRRWERYDPELYQALQRLLEPEVTRSVHHAAAWGLLPGATYFNSILGDSLGERHAYFAGAREALAETELVFFDPDNGIEVPSVSAGRRNSGKYLYWNEIEDWYRHGYSMVIYQHFQRKRRDEFIEDLAGQLQTGLAGSAVASFRTSHVVFLLVIHERCGALQPAVLEAVEERWKEQIVSRLHGSTSLRRPDDRVNWGNAPGELPTPT